jgi:hypothetical protein
MDKKVDVKCFILLVFIMVGLTSSEVYRGDGAGAKNNPTTIPRIEWEHTFGGYWWEIGRSLIQTDDGGFVLAGETDSYGAGDSDCWLVKTDSSGNHEWNQTFGGIGEDVPYDLIQTVDGGFAFTGHTHSYGARSPDIWLVKTDSNGHHKWNQTFGGNASDTAISLIQTEEEGFALAGITNSMKIGNSEMWLVKTDSSGHHEWNQTFGGTGEDSASALIQTADKGFVLAGVTNSYGAGHYDMWLVKANSSGKHQWHRTFGGTERDDLGYNSFIQTVDGGFVLAGTT